MSGSLMTLGILILAFIVFGHITHQIMPGVPYLDFLDDFQNTIYLALASGGAIAAGILLKVLAPVKKAVIRTKCKKCGVRVPAGDIYCLSCMKELQGRRR